MDVSRVWEIIVQPDGGTIIHVIMDGVAVRGPVPVGFLADIVFLTERETTVEDGQRSHKNSSGVMAEAMPSWLFVRRVRYFNGESHEKDDQKHGCCS